MKQPEQQFLVCATLDAEFTVKGASFDKRCSRCSCRVMISPSGLDRLKKGPHTLILCAGCLNDVVKEQKHTTIVPNSPEAMADLKRHIPNPHRNRN